MSFLPPYTIKSGQTWESRQITDAGVDIYDLGFEIEDEWNE